MVQRKISVVAHNIRSSHNVGSIFRTCDGFGIEHLYLTGYTPYPAIQNDTRLPHISEKATAEIAKTALGAEATVPFSYIPHASTTIDAFKSHGYTIVGLEQDDTAIKLPEFEAPEKIMLLLGEEVEGISAELRKKCDILVEIPMNGSKESFNVSVATGIALYSLTY
ncbi:hypothetical protein A3F64_00230 [Candidatus Saccharibacteria bacterium RIFCSPHIGHO2_12_FULL_42_8]|nr:MAG: hypothetical protein A3F64_00230 [Candidatus Saccharibacteria bacterium RIFCSPHIGHO2_12_FULL_42_8]